ncbi:MAG: hypothetical protein GF372_11570, partial [Candidatus Marinimicrobia bacterium]|nr:hypothetical protein [Candidatus Neomarinimicrobiota bacterium]
MTKRCTLFMLMVFFLPLSVVARSPYIEIDSTKNRDAAAFHIEELPVILDGKLDDPAWIVAAEYGNFVQREPNDGSEPTYPTFFRVVYDEEYLYVGIEAFDEEPDKIKAILSRRDEYTNSDWLYVSLDSYNDNRTAFEFGLNAAGVKHDLRRFDDERADFDWDAVWDGAVSINENGWSAEFKIPFRELRFTSADMMEWGLQVYREFPRNNNELSVWSYWSQEEAGFVSNYGKLHGLENVTSQKPLYVAPYVLGKSEISQNLRNEAHPEVYDLSSNIGGDVRYSFSNGLTLNATVNPDFGQVEADPADYNLTNFETYFNEKRPFFLEGGNIFNFSLGFGDGDMQDQSLFYSRRIGRSPHLSLDDHGREYIQTDSPEATSIISAAKLTGKTRGGTSVGVMNAVTAEETGTITFEPGDRDTQVLEPLTNYFLSRIQQDYRDGNTTIGGMLSAVNRRMDDTNITSLRSEAYTGGLDLNHKFWDRNYIFQAALAFSRVGGTQQSILETQTNPTHYFQRPDADHLSVDSTATHLSGFGQKLVLAKTGGGHFRGAVGLLGTSPGFEVNDLGFYPRVDQQNQFVWLHYRQWEQTKFFNEYYVNVNQWTEWTNEPELVSLGYNLNAHSTLRNNWRAGGGIGRNESGLLTAEMRGGPAIRYDTRVFGWGYIGTDTRKDFSARGSINILRGADDVKSNYYSLDLTFRPRQNVQITVEPSFHEFDDTWAWSTKAELDDGSYRYIFADLAQRTVSAQIRLDYTLMPNLSIQYYGQPFITTGKYSNHKVVTDPRADAFGDRFHQFSENEVTIQDDDYVVDRNQDGNVDYSFDPRDDFT